ncbi:ImmA/IrrE family metallo-endopeptidase [Nostoc sp. XA010]|nr:ImmA/IrrE family metallo-endopeptidase [Nostoc sp. XA010]
MVYNPRHAPTRYKSNLMHEIAHLLLNHKPVGFDSVTGLPKRKQNNDCQ